MRINSGMPNAKIQMPSAAAIQAACVLGTKLEGEAAANVGGGWPKMPFPGTGALSDAGLSPELFPDNLRLLPQYELGADDDAN